MWSSAGKKPERPWVCINPCKASVQYGTEKKPTIAKRAFKGLVTAVSLILWREDIPEEHVTITWVYLSDYCRLRSTEIQPHERCTLMRARDGWFTIERSLEETPPWWWSAQEDLRVSGGKRRKVGQAVSLQPWKSWQWGQLKLQPQQRRSQ